MANYLCQFSWQNNIFVFYSRGILTYDQALFWWYFLGDIGSVAAQLPVKLFLSLKRDSRPTVDVDCKTAVFLRIQVRASSQTKGSAARLKMESETAKRRKKYSRPGSSKDGYV